MGKNVSAAKEWRFAIRHGTQGVGAFKVQMSKRDIYVFIYERDGSSSEHFSYHGSGQQHIKWSGQYRFYRRDRLGNHRPEIWSAPPPQQVPSRQQMIGLSWHLVDYLGIGPWPIQKIRRPELVDVPTDRGYDSVLFQFSAVGSSCPERGDYFGHEIFWRKRLTAFVVVEIEGVGMRSRIN